MEVTRWSAPKSEILRIDSLVQVFGVVLSERAKSRSIRRFAGTLAVNIFVIEKQ
jgi:hypothetical protein